MGPTMATLRCLYPCILWALLAAILTPAAGQISRVTQIQPNYGGRNGAVRITIFGEGFADASQFDYSSDNNNEGNSVQMVTATQSIPCDVEKDASHSGLLTCNTRAMPFGTYTVQVSVNGNVIPNECPWWSGWCQFTAYWYHTPTLTSIAPLSGLPGSMITISGKIFTDVYGSNTAVSSNGLNVRILRTYAGGMPCELLAPNSDTLYGLQLTSYDEGTMICKMTGTYVGHHNVSFILDSQYGRSAPERNTYFVSSQNKIAMFQTYAVVSSISPAAGSIQGGNLLTVTGQYFDATDQPISVLLGGQSCDVQDHTDSAIRCVAPSKPTRDQLNFTTVFPGGRGLMLQVWNNNNPSSLEDALTYNENTTGYVGASWVDSASYKWSQSQNVFVARLSGFFVPPESDNYTFIIKATNRFALYFSQTGHSQDKAKVASGSSYWYNWYNTQYSPVFLLQKGREYYMEIYAQHNNNYGYPTGFVEVALFSELSSYTNQQFVDAVTEGQALQSSSDVVLEKQVITLENWMMTNATEEVQTITVACADSCSFFYFALIYNMEKTIPLSADASHLEVQSALNDLWSIKPDTVEVSRIDDIDDHNYTVIFHSQRGDFHLLDYEIVMGINITIDIVEQTKGIPSMQDFTLMWDGITSEPIAAQASAAEVQDAILGMISSICPDSIANVTENSYVKYFNNYETELGRYSGQRTTEVDAFCGRYTLKNPNYMFHSSVQSPGGQPYGAISLTSTNKFCFAYRGFLQEQIYLYFEFEGIDFTVRSYAQWFPYDFVQEDSWSYTCINLLDLIQTNYPEGSNYNLHFIYMLPSNSAHPLYVDVMYIGQTVTTDDQSAVSQRRPPAMASRGEAAIFINYIQVDETQPSSPDADKQYTVTISAFDCAFNIPLLAVAFAQEYAVDGGNISEYRGSTWPNGSMITIKRTQAASPPINGTFDIEAYGTTLRGLRVDISAVDLQFALQSIPDMGQVRVTEWYGSCTGYGREIRWLTASGKQPLLQVDGSNLTGIHARVSVREEEKGGLLRRTILGDVLRTPHAQPQLTVLINGIPSICSGNCSYSWDTEKTPVISGIDPTEELVTNVEEGSINGYVDPFLEGRNLTISGSGFANSRGNDNTSVFIGPVRCPIISVSENEIICQILSGSAGSFPVVIYIAEHGLAESNETFNFTYKIHVSNISPATGSLAGGTLLTITGNGFDEQSQVSLDGNPCDVIRRSLTEIQCRTPPGQSGSANVDVFVNGLNVTLSDHFEYTSANTPVITDVIPNTSSVLGNTSLTLVGSNFGSAPVDISVYIGAGLCPVLEMNSTHVVCLLPSLPPGEYPVLLQVGNLSLASLSDPSKANITYILEITSISPQRGSVYGGTKITITGSGFSTDPESNEVQLDSTPCQVTSLAENRLECIIQSSRATHVVTNNGRDLSYGLGYAWSPAYLDISVGDTVVWQWEPQPFVVGLSYRVFSVSSPGSSVYDGEGFQSADARKESGSFSYQFTSPGVYYYSSGSVSYTNGFSLQGGVRVLPVPERKAELHVRVGGHEALHNPAPAPAHGRRSAEDCMAQEPECNQLSNGNSSENVIFFEFSNCYSASITGITPSNGTALDPITITGTGFSSIPCANEVKIGSHPCTVLSNSGHELTCKVDPENSMNIGTAEMVSINVHNLGAAINTLTKEFDRRFVLLPHMNSVTPSIGSLTGKTRFTIQGSGFAAPQSWIKVTMAGYANANIVSVNYTHIECDTLSVDFERKVDLKVVILGIPAQCRGSCSFSYSRNVTSVISSVTPTILQNVSTEIVIEGEGFGSKVEDILVYIGDEAFEATDVTENNITCLVTPLPAGTYTLTVVVLSKGLATGSLTLNSPAVASLSPLSGGIMGGTTLAITGNGFDTNNTRVTIGGYLCKVLSVTPGEVQCITPARSAGAANVQIVVNSVVYPPLSFTYSESDTPRITTVIPDTGSAGTTVTISGSGLGSVSSDVTVTIDKVACDVQSVNDSKLQCTIGNHVGGNFSVVFHHVEKGFAVTNAFFMYAFSINTVFPQEGSFGGGQMLTVSGTGFDSNNSHVFICSSECRVNPELSDLSALLCEVPPNNGTGESENCSVRVVNGGDSITYQNPYTYQSSLTPTISDVMPRRGGTGGGTHLTITGTGFSSNTEDVDVTIAGDTCVVISANKTHIICRTAAHSPSQRTKVKVNIGGNGIAKLDHADFFYIDVWSSNYTWGGLSPPEDGSLAVITQGQTILLDANTTVLKMLVIQGGTLMFDEADIELQAENILITEGGVLQIGTEGAPFQHKAIITLHGHLRSKELPLYGAKTLAVRGGILDLHGLPVPVTWTRLAQTAEAGSSTLALQVAVTWKVGDEIVIASTGNRLSQSQNEKRVITQVSEDGRRLHINSPLTYKHLGISVTLPNGKVFEARAEVGLLTRNILIRGSDNVEWQDNIAACPEGFDPGEFATQTCFQGRFGEEIGSDQFGGCIMFHAPQPNKRLAIGRIEYVEVFHAGQAFRLGRYPIHWHLMGDMQFTSYVRGCAIHQTYNRAVTIHNTHHLLVENNVIYDIMGGAFFIEDGIEHGNILQYNLAVFVKQSTSLLNDDVTPAAFWVTNPNNTIRHNAAAGGTHFGFWYRMHDHPDGSSYDPNVCQKRVPLGEFYNNTVHSQGWFGIWIFESYYPAQGGYCYSYTPQTAIFDSLTTWNCQKGAEWVNGGALLFRNFLMVNNENAGIETKRILLDYVGGWGETSGAVIKNATIVGHLDELGLGASYCTSRGIVLPFDEGLTVSSTKFINFDRNCAAIGVTSVAGVCTDRCGGWSAKFDGIQFFNTSNKAGFRWEHEVVLIDDDGSLTGAPGRKVVPRSPLLNPSNCSQSAEWSFGFDGFICNSSVSFHRLAFNNPSPSSLIGQDVILSNAYGVSTVPYLPKRLTHKPGWMALLPNANSFNWYFHDAEFITNISYAATFYGFKAEEYIIISHNFTQRPDRFHIIDSRNRSEQLLSYSSNINGDWNFDNDTKTLTYLVAGQKPRRMSRAIAGVVDPTMTNINVNLEVYQCYYKDCITPPTQPPPPPPPQNTSGQSPDYVRQGFEINYWSNDSFWLNNRMSVPTNGSDVVIPAGKWVIADIQTPTLEKLTIYGVLELINLTEPSSGYKTVVLSATYISIQGGQLIGGWENDPFQGDLHIVLKGSHSTPESLLPNGPIQGSKVLGVFGALDLHGIPHSVYKTKLSQTALAGSINISLVDVVDWKVGEDIVITTTSYDAWQTETRRIVYVSLDRRTLTLNQSLSFGHIAETHQVPDTNVSYTLAADIGVLSRNIKIIGEDYPGWYKESFGARVLVGKFTANGRIYRGSARISNVEFYHSGQEGYRDGYDPRYSLAFLNLNEVQSNESYVQGCAFHNGFSPAIGVFGTNGLNVDDNIIHFTVGEGIRLWGQRNKARRNLVTLAVWPSTYQDRLEINNNLLWHAGIEVNEGRQIVLQDNIVAGFERVAYRINGEPCSGANSLVEQWSNNEAHGGLYGVYMQEDGLPGCSLIQGFTLWRCWDYGIYFQTTQSVQIDTVSLVDNGMGILSIIYTPSATTHATSNKTVAIKNSLLVGSSPNFNCSDVLTNSDANLQLSLAHRSTRPPKGGRSGISWPTFASGHNGAPGKPHAGLLTYNAITGLMTVKDSLFVGFKNVCSVETNVMFITNPLNEDLQHPVHVSGIQMADTANEAKIFIHRPDVGKANPSDCVDMVCDAKRKALLKDLDGSLLGSPGSVVAQSEYQWGGVASYGIGDYRIPKVMLTYLNGSRIPVNQIAPNKGIIRDSTCVFMSTWEGYNCTGLDHEMLAFESLDSDSETRRLSPVAVLGDGYMDLINGPQDHGWCSGYTCQKRVSLFHSIVASGKHFDIFFTSTSPQKLRLMLLNVDNTKAIRVAIYYSSPQRLDVFVNNSFVGPTNVEWNADRTDFTLKEPTYAGQYVPALNSTTPGENYFDSTYQMLYILLRGSTPVEVRTSPLLMIAFNLPAMTVDQFYDGKNLVNNLAIFLKIPANKIRITKIIAASSKRRKRATGLAVTVQIAEPPTLETSNSTNTTGQLQYSDLQNISRSIAAAAVTGSLSSSLKVTVASVAVKDPSPPPDDPKWQQMASSDVTERTEAEASFVSTVTKLIVVTHPEAGLPGQLLTQQPSIQAVDDNHNCVAVDASALTLTAKLVNSANAYVTGGLTGSTTISFSSCWANYTDLVLVPAGTGYKIEFSLNNVLAQTRNFDSKASAVATTPTTPTTTKKSIAGAAVFSTPSSASGVRRGLAFQALVLFVGLCLGML